MGGKGSGRKKATPPKFAKGLEPYERQPKETDKAWQAFTVYRDLGVERSTAAVAKVLGKSQTLMTRWSGRWGWVERVHAWDRRLDDEIRAAALDAATIRGEEKAKVVDGLWMIGGQELMRLQKIIKAEKGKKLGGKATLTPRDAVRYIRDGVKLSRLLEGDPTKIVRTDDTENAAQYRKLMQTKEGRELLQRLDELLGDVA